MIFQSTLKILQCIMIGNYLHFYFPATLFSYFSLENEKFLKPQINELKWIDFPLLIKKLLEHLWRVSKCKDSPMLNEIAHASATILLSCINSQPNFVQTVQDFKDMEKFVLATLLESPASQLREEVANLICQLCTSG